jgi:cold shock CspA family protein
MRVQAKIVTWFPLRGFGFANCHDGAAPDVFVHIHDVDKDFLHVGDRIEFEIEMQERGPIARQVRVLEFA